MSFITTIGGKTVVCSVMGAFALGVVTPPAIKHIKRSVARTHKVASKPHVKPATPIDCVVSVPLAFSYEPIFIPLTPLPDSFTTPSLPVIKHNVTRHKTESSPLPEPATWITLLSGFFLLGINLRKRNAKKATT